MDDAPGLAKFEVFDNLVDKASCIVFIARLLRIRAILIVVPPPHHKDTENRKQEAKHSFGIRADP